MTTHMTLCNKQLIFDRNWQMMTNNESDVEGDDFSDIDQVVYLVAMTFTDEQSADERGQFLGMPIHAYEPIESPRVGL